VVAPEWVDPHFRRLAVHALAVVLPVVIASDARGVHQAQWLRLMQQPDRRLAIGQQPLCRAIAERKRVVVQRMLRHRLELTVRVSIGVDHPQVAPAVEKLLEFVHRIILLHVLAKICGAREQLVS
jgi:hypothetical protein